MIMQAGIHMSGRDSAFARGANPIMPLRSCRNGRWAIWVGSDTGGFAFGVGWLGKVGCGDQWT